MDPEQPEDLEDYNAPIEVDDQTFMEEVVDAPFAIVDFWAPWCSSCMDFKPVFEEVARELGDQIKFISANIDEVHDTSIALQISAIPTLVFFMRGEEVLRDAAINKEGFLGLIRKVL